MGMYQDERSYTCPVCGAGITKEVSTTAKQTYRVGTCSVCGYERDSKPSHTRNKFPVTYITIPEQATPREGVQHLADNADISLSEAASILNPDTDDVFEDQPSK